MGDVVHSSPSRLAAVGLEEVPYLDIAHPENSMVFRVPNLVRGVAKVATGPSGGEMPSGHLFSKDALELEPTHSESRAPWFWVPRLCLPANWTRGPRQGSRELCWWLA